MSDTIWTFVTSFIGGSLGGGVIGALVVYFFKGSIDHHFKVAFERVRTELTIAAAEHQIRFSKLHERRAEVVAETYARMRNYLVDVYTYTSPLKTSDMPPTLKEQRDAADKSGKEFRAYFFPNEIYFPEEIATDIRDFDRSLFKAGREFYLLTEDPNRAAIPPDQAKERWETKGEPLLDALEPHFERLRAHFQELIGGTPAQKT